MSFASFQNIFRPSRDVTGMNVYSSTTSEYSALIISTKMQLGDREVVFAAVYGQFDHALIGGSANTLEANAMPDPSKQVVYYKGDQIGQAFFSTPEGPPPCASFTHCIYVFGVQDNKVLIQGTAGVAYTISLADATQITMQDLVSGDTWCKPPVQLASLASSARDTDTNTTSNWVIGVGIGLLVVLVLLYFFGSESKPSKQHYPSLRRRIQQRKNQYQSPLRLATSSPANNRVVHYFE